MPKQKELLSINKGELYPVLPLRDIVVFPHMIVPLFVGREKSVLALEEMMLANKKELILVTQKSPSDDNPIAKDLYSVGTLGTLLQLLKLPDGTVKVLVEGTQRIQLNRFVEESPYFQAYGSVIPEEEGSEEELEALIRAVVSQFEQYVKLNRKIPPEVLVTINQIADPAKLADTVASYFSLKIPDKQILLETANVSKRLEKVLGYIESESAVLHVEKKIRTRVKKQMEKTQREYYLNEQLKAINKELGDGEDGKDEIAELENRIKKVKLSKEAKEKALSEVRKLKVMNSSSAESTVLRNYLDWLLGIPWQQRSRTKNDLGAAEGVLNKDHYGLDKVKERILEYLAVQARVGKVRGQILCLVGPPGVGKTSLGKSLAKATGRNFVRISLGGVRDESEVRGHRRTYIGSMPGKIIQSMKKAKTSNPLILLDEIDKLGSDWRGDPASALLEVLDPEQNATFNDHYLEVDYDLSDVMFVTTANTLKMPQPLLDRMEVIRIPGYTEDEKLAIAKQYLLPKQMSQHGLKAAEFSVTNDALLILIRNYTREAGVRSLEREVTNLCRKAVREIMNPKLAVKKIKIGVDNLGKYAGVKRFRYGLAEEKDTVGVTTGLAWTETGGELLSIEAVVLPGKGKTLITGKLGDVMQESVQAALSYVRARSPQFGLKPSLFERKDIHIHVPEGAIPKDGPSAGITMCTAIVSVLTGIPVSKDVAMTGEVTLRGNVLPIGGLKEKLLAAHRGGIKTVIIPYDNEKDLADIPENVTKGLTIVPVKHVDEVIRLALSSEPQPIEYSEDEEEERIAKKQTLVDDETLATKTVQ
ncbi:MAG: endopeptidase La [Pseudomonadota bacterium]|jgi:ATP-dependent Lon protease|nr:endopeptidase La [Alphaproteobacteria bacterium]